MLIWRRSYDVAPPGGESLKDTLARALPYYMQHIQPDVLSGKTRAGLGAWQFAPRPDHGDRGPVRRRRF